MKLLLSKWPDLIITFIRVLCAGLTGFWIAKWQIKKHKALELSKKKITLKKLLKGLKLN